MQMPAPLFPLLALMGGPRLTPFREPLIDGSCFDRWKLLLPTGGLMLPAFEFNADVLTVGPPATGEISRHFNKTGTSPSFTL